jgi:hypothetical protein
MEGIGSNREDCLIREWTGPRCNLVAIPIDEVIGLKNGVVHDEQNAALGIRVSLATVLAIDAAEKSKHAGLKNFVDFEHIFVLVSPDQVFFSFDHL